MKCDRYTYVPLQHGTEQDGEEAPQQHAEMSNQVFGFPDYKSPLQGNTVILETVVLIAEAAACLHSKSLSTAKWIGKRKSSVC